MGLTKDKEFLLMELREMGIRDTKVLDAIEKTKRELFVPDNLIEDAYKNYPLPIGHAQTISQPYTVAYMLELLHIQPNNKILEIGAGSGYCAAVMSCLAKEIIGVELIPELCEFAKQNIKKAGIENVRIINTNGYHGHIKDAPYDRIILSCASTDIPKSLIHQLKEKGIMVIPLTKYYCEIMTRVVKNNEIKISNHGEFSFVPLKI